MKISAIDYHLPRKYIAQTPLSPRDHSNLLVLDRTEYRVDHTHFYDIPKLLSKNDVLVFNQTKVFPARMMGRKKTGGKAEVLLLKDLGNSSWEAITKPGFAVNEKIYFDDFNATITKRAHYVTEIKFSLPKNELYKHIQNIGITPTPPYIESQIPENELRVKYQTVYAKNVGSAAAPTAGFHFTKRLLKVLAKKGVQMEYVTLHVGLGTFAPVKEENIEDHNIHSEEFYVDKNTINRLNKAKKEGKRIIAVGTTTTRVLETLVDKHGLLSNDFIEHATKLYIYPPFKFKFIDALITNFHLPKSTLLALVSAFVSYPNTKDKFVNFRSSSTGTAYKEAIKRKYRFYSFGDAMFIK